MCDASVLWIQPSSCYLKMPSKGVPHMVENPTPKDVEKMPTIRIILDDNGEEFNNLTMFGQL